jgi:hypothetical protein
MSKEASDHNSKQSIKKTKTMMSHRKLEEEAEAAKEREIEKEREEKSNIS